MTTKVVAIVSEKGGVGKTTVTTNLGVAAHLAGLDVAIVDLDPQTNAADWFDERGAGSLPEAVAIQPNRLKRFLDDLRANGTKLVLIDTPREAGNAGYVAAENADFVLVPYKRGGHDLRALDRTLNMCRLAGKRPHLVLNYIRPGATRVEADARESVAGKDCEVAPVVLHEWTAYDTTSITTRTAQETDPGSPVAKEIEALYLWLAGQLGLPTTRQSDRKAAVS
ncbi:MAG: ParA family protein [Stellaceae bacterium]